MPSSPPAPSGRWCPQAPSSSPVPNSSVATTPRICPRAFQVFAAPGERLIANRRAGGQGLNRHRHGLEGAVAIDQVDPLLHDAEAVAVAAEAVLLAAGEDALGVVAIFHHDHGRADDVFAVGG